MLLTFDDDVGFSLIDIMINRKVHRVKHYVSQFLLGNDIVHVSVFGSRFIQKNTSEIQKYRK